MVKLDSEYVKKLRERWKNSYKTHLYTNNKHVEEIQDGAFVNIPEVTVIYLHSNLLKSGQNLSMLTNLTHLYLQWNKITSLKDLHDLPNLTSLYISHNSIDILDGPIRVPKLKVLQMQNQILSNNAMKFSFNTQILTELSPSLMKLNVSGNSIGSTNELQLLNQITHLDISNNLITDINDVCHTVRKLKHLKSLKIDENPLTKNIRYEYDIIASSQTLEKINTRAVSTATRIFMQSLKAARIQHERRKEKNRKIEFSTETKNFVQHLPPEFREIVMGYALQNTQQKMHNNRTPRI